MATAAQRKAERIAAQDAANTAAYRAALVAPAKTQAQIDAINAGVKASAETSGITYNPETALTLQNQVSINPNVKTTQNYATGTRVDTLNVVPKVSGLLDSDKDAIAIMTDTLKQWGLEDLADTFGRLMIEGFSSGEALNKLKYDKTVDPITNKPYNAAYTLRFAGNAARVAKGLNAYDEGTYLNIENSYNDTLTRYGLSNIIKPDATGKRAQFAGYMASDIAPLEFAERIKNVSERVLNMDPKIKAQFQAYYPSLSDTDLVSYFLDPKETLPVLKNKITAAEIGTVASAAQYGIGRDRAMDLAQFGVTREQALAGYQDIAEAVPTGTKLSSIYREEGIQYGQAAAEDEFLKQDAQAKLKRNRLASKERASFQGSAGTTSVSLKKSTAGQI